MRVTNRSAIRCPSSFELLSPVTLRTPPSQGTRELTRGRRKQVAAAAREGGQRYSSALHCSDTQAMRRTGKRAQPTLCHCCKRCSTLLTEHSSSRATASLSYPPHRSILPPLSLFARSPLLHSAFFPFSLCPSLHSPRCPLHCHLSL